MNNASKQSEDIGEKFLVDLIEESRRAVEKAREEELKNKTSDRIEINSPYLSHTQSDYGRNAMDELDCMVSANGLITVAIERMKGIGGVDSEDEILKLRSVSEFCKKHIRREEFLRRKCNRIGDGPVPF